MKRLFFLLVSFVCVNVVFAQSNIDTNITGDDAGWGDWYDLVYKVDGQVYKTITLAEGSEITPELAPTKEGYTFSGWSEIPATMPDNDVEITGTFSINSYKLVYKVDGTEYKTYTLEYGSVIIPETEPVKEGHTFSGWSEIPTSIPANDVEITGSFTINSYILTYILDGVEYKKDTLQYASTIIAEVDPEKEGYTFSGWRGLPTTMPAKDVTVTGSFGQNTYKLTYKVDGEIYRSFYIEYNATINIEPEPTKEGYIFSGWSEIPENMPAHNVEVTGTFSIGLFLLIYNVDDTLYHVDTLIYNSEITPLPEPEIEGYTFSGWSKIPATMPGKNVEITGKFKVNSYKLVYYVDGEEYRTSTYTYGSPVTPKTAPSKRGYTFSGWSEIPETMPAHDVDVFGTFSINKYLLTYKVDGEIYHTDTLTYESAITALAEPVKEGYTFSGWSDIPATMPNKDVEISGKFKVNNYKLVYIVDGEEYRTYTQAYGSTITPKSELTKKGFTFSGWSEIPATMPAYDVTVTGTFSRNSYLLVYKVDGEVYHTDTIMYESAITALAAPIREGYTFSGWKDLPATMPYKDVEVTGKFKINSYNLTYILDGEVYKSYTVEYGDDITPERNPSKDGFTFSGWSEIPATMPANDVTVTGSFGEKTYKLVYKVDGVEYKTYNIAYGAAIITEPAPTKEGYTFSGWSIVPATMPAKDVEVTGRFSINSYKLVYKVDSTEYKSYTLNYGSTITAEPAPNKEGYTFSGWSEIPATMPAKDVEVIGRFNINSYKLVYKVDGVEYKTSTLNYGSTITSEPEPSKEGYTFSGWSEIPATMPAKDVEVTGRFSINSYKLVYKVDGTEYKTSTLNYGSTITSEPEPSKEGYTFSGWSEIPATMPAKDVEVNGRFSINSYKLVYKVDGTEYKTSTLNYGSTITSEPEPSKEGYTFSGWSEIPATMPAKDVEVTGRFSINSYKLVYKVDGTEYKTSTLNYGSTITAESEPSKEGYTFSGWSEIPSTMPAKDVEVNGRFSINSYKLVYKVDGTEYKTSTLNYGSTITAEPEPSKEGYTFSGWSEIPATMPANDVEVTGRFSINSYKLVYKVDGTEYKTSTLNYGSTITAEPEPSKEGYTFSGWSEIPSTMPAKDVEVNGRFSINSYKLVYKVDGTEYKTSTLNYGSTITAEPEPSKEGYTFSGWSEIPATMPANDVEVTGRFSINSYKLVYKVDGTEYKTSTLNYGSTITAEPEPSKEGYTFSGWSEIPATMPANDVEVTGRFSINSYKLVYKVDGTEYKTSTLNYGSTITAEPEPSKEGYTFSGWSEIPTTMPAKDIEVTGGFSVNKYLLTVIVDEEVVFSDSIAYGVRLAEYLDELTQQGVDFTKWELYDQIDTITMPAQDVTINAIDDAVDPILMDMKESIIYDLTGKKIETDDISTLPSGIYILNGFKYIVY